MEEQNDTEATSAPRLTLDGLCALARSLGHVVVVDDEGAQLVDLAELDPIAWVP